MSIRFIPPRRFLDPQERLSYQSLQLLASGGRAIVEPDSVGLRELNEAAAIAAVGAVSTAPLVGTLTVTVLVAVPAATGALLDSADSVGSPAGVTSVDTVVRCLQTDVNFYFTAYVSEVPNGLGGTSFRINFVAKNHDTAAHNVTIGQVIKYAVFSGVAADEQPRSPNAELVVTPGCVWIDPATGLPFEPNKPVDVGNMNATAAPTLAIADHSIKEVELRAHDVSILGALYTGRRAIFVVPSSTAVPVGAAVLLGTVVLTGVAGPNVEIGQATTLPLFTGYVTSLIGGTTISIYARNNAFQSITVPAGLQLKVLAY